MPKHERWNSRAIMWPCKDCGCDVSPVRDGKRWGVSDKVWKQAGMKPQGKRPFGTGVLSVYEHYEPRRKIGTYRSWHAVERAIEHCGDRMVRARKLYPETPYPKTWGE